MKNNCKAITAVKAVNSGLLHFETFCMAMFTIALVAAIFIEVICRYLLFISVAWAEEISRYLFIWLAYIGSAYAFYEGSHVEIDILPQILAKGKHGVVAVKVLTLISNIATVSFIVIFGKMFFEYMMQIWRKTQTSPTMHIPMGLVYLPVFIGSVFGGFHVLCLIIEQLAEFRNSTGTSEPKENT